MESELDSDGLALLFLVLGVAAVLFTFVAYVLTNEDDDDEEDEEDFYLFVPPSPSMEIDGMIVSYGTGRSAMRIIDEQFIQKLPHYEKPEALPQPLPTNDACAICLEDLVPPTKSPQPNAPSPSIGSEEKERDESAPLVEAKQRKRAIRTVVVELPCGHFFHETCITPWLYFRSAECPLCKQDVRTATPPVVDRDYPQTDAEDAVFDEEPSGGLFGFLASLTHAWKPLAVEEANDEAVPGAF